MCLPILAYKSTTWPCTKGNLNERRVAQRAKRARGRAINRISLLHNARTQHGETRSHIYRRSLGDERYPWLEEITVGGRPRERGRSPAGGRMTSSAW